MGRYTLTLDGPSGTLDIPAPPSVTTILGETMPKGGGMPWWGYKLACYALLEATQNSRKGIEFLTEHTDGEELYEALKKRRKVTPHTELKKAGERGTAVHDYAEARIRGELSCMDDATPDPAEDLAGYLQAADKWIAERLNGQWEVMAIEQPLISTRYGFVGTADLILRQTDEVFGDTYRVADFKSSKAIHASHKLQLAFYEQAARELGLIPADDPCDNLVIRLGADGEYEEQPSHCTLADVETTLAQYHMLKGLE